MKTCTQLRAKGEPLPTAAVWVAALFYLLQYLSFSTIIFIKLKVFSQVKIGRCPILLKMTNLYRIYLITNYEIYFQMGNAVVGAESSQQALHLLEDYLRHDPNIKESLRGREDIGFLLRGEIRETQDQTTKQGVLYPFAKKLPSST